MDTGVREILVKALNQSAARVKLQAEWGPRFAKAWNEEERIYSYELTRDEISEVSQEMVERILGLYTKAEILSILAVARFEGIWRPE